MNELIKELAEQAGMTDDKFGMFFAKDKHNEDGVDLEKFAELIVQRCADIVYRCSAGECYSGYEFKFAGDKIKKHFGVEK
jgi:hypothetical protein